MIKLRLVTLIDNLCILKMTLGKKINVLGAKLKEINTKIQIELFDKKLAEKNSQEILKNYEIVLDCTDNFPTRYEINRLVI